MKGVLRAVSATRFGTFVCLFVRLRLFETRTNERGETRGWGGKEPRVAEAVAGRVSRTMVARWARGHGQAGRKGRQAIPFETPPPHAAPLPSDVCPSLSPNLNPGRALLTSEASFRACGLLSLGRDPSPGGLADPWNEAGMPMPGSGEEGGTGEARWEEKPVRTDHSPQGGDS